MSEDNNNTEYPASERPEEDYSWLDTVQKGTGERAGPLYRCLMVTTGREAYVQKLLKALNLGESIIPEKIKIIKRGGAWKEVLTPMLPGYLFVHETEEVPILRYQQLLDVIRVLRYEKEPYGYMKERDLHFAETIFRVEGTVRPLKATEVNGYVNITDELLDDLNGTVLSVNRHKRVAKIRIDIMGTTRVVYLSYELTERIVTTDDAGVEEKYAEEEMEAKAGEGTEEEEEENNAD